MGHEDVLALGQGTLEAFMQTEKDSVFNDPTKQAIYSHCLMLMEVTLSKTADHQSALAKLGIQSTHAMTDIFGVLRVLAKLDASAEEGDRKTVKELFPIAAEDQSHYFMHPKDLTEGNKKCLRHSGLVRHNAASVLLCSCV